MDTEKVSFNPLAESQKKINETIPPTIQKLIALKHKNEIHVVDANGSPLVESFLKPENVLGRGETALVLSGTYQGKDVAIKIFTSTEQEMTEEKLKEVMTNESKDLEEVKHPNIAEYYGSGEIKVTEIKRLPVIVRELIPLSLEKKTADKKLSIIETISLTKSIASALEYIYDTKHLVQTDITPANLGQREDGTWVIVEFGYLAQAGTKKTVGIDDGFTAPEIITAKDDVKEQNYLASPITEVYSLGLIAWSCLTGKKVNRENYILNLPIPITQENLPEPIFSVLQKAISADPHQRYATPMEFANALEFAYGDYSI